jgi:hypothetical protein
MPEALLWFVRMRLAVFIALALTAQAQSSSAETPDESFRVYTDHPRLLLRAHRLRLLKRERERQSMRWTQFEALVKGGVQMPEPGFAFALYYAVTGDAAAAKRAIEWALSPGADIRQTALVFDWCQSALTPALSKALAARLTAAAGNSNAQGIRAIRTRAFAAIAAADESGDRAEAAMTDIVARCWRKQVAPALAGGRDFAPGEDTFALMELLHAVRDNLNIDLRESAGDYFKQFPAFYVESHYPAPYPAAENEYRIPVYKGAGQPDLKAAAVSRAAGLALVAFDTNAIENQFVQGWLMQDRFLLRGAFGSPYEFLWANPYQPGLSYAHLPLVFHDPRSGDVFIRSSWEEDAEWFGLFQGEAQVFRDGKITVLRQTPASASQTPKIPIGDTATVVLGRSGVRFKATGDKAFVIGLKPRAAYDVEVDDEEMTETETDAAGTLEISLPKNQETGVKITERTEA